jgi:hypothetical protein
MIAQESSINNSYGTGWNLYNSDPCGFAKNMLVDPCEVFACCQAGGAFDFDFFEEDDARSVTAPSTTAAATATDPNKSASSLRTTEDDELDQELENFNIDINDDLPSEDCIYSSFHKPSEPVVQDRLQAISAQRKKNENNRQLLQERGQKAEGLACKASQILQNASDYKAGARVLKEKCKNRNHNNINNNIIMRRWRLAARKSRGVVKSKEIV